MLTTNGAGSVKNILQSVLYLSSILRYSLSMVTSHATKASFSYVYICKSLVITRLIF